jgi:hypothetical protein
MLDTSYEFLDFESNSEYELLKFQFANNSQFKIPVWKPNPNKPCQGVLIMINGFLEGVHIDQRKRNQYLNRYDAIAQKIKQERNMASVLMPMPFHFERSIDIQGEKDYAPLRRLTENGTFLYFGGFTQIIADIEKLVNDIQAKPTYFGIPESTELKFHLLGYSLGGVAAIGSSHNLSLKSTLKFESLTVMLSAWNISKIDPQALANNFGDKFGLTVELWEKMMKELSSIRETSSAIFRKLIWDEGDSIKFNSCAKKVLFINGLGDDIFTHDHSTASRNQALEVLKECTFIQIPVDHLAIRSRESIAGYVSNFICN